ncbi:hypothetical protein [Nonomuraea cavernae]|uniref:hypothetical protein n=1 Tax=Nonomuraea cavernae TaxID=2045107 RepID=UPI00340562DA
MFSPGVSQCAGRVKAPVVSYGWSGIGADPPGWRWGGGGAKAPVVSGGLDGGGGGTCPGSRLGIGAHWPVTSTWSGSDGQPGGSAGGCSSESQKELLAVGSGAAAHFAA